MERRYDLFELAPYGFPRWLDSASDLSEAMGNMRELPTPVVGGEYLVRDFYSGMVVAYTDHSGRFVSIPMHNND